MRKLLSIVMAMGMCIVLLSCSGTDTAKTAIEEKDYAKAQEEIQNIKNDDDKAELTELYEDTLFADAAAYLNNQQYAEAYSIAQQSISGKAKDAVMFVTVRDFIQDSVLDGFGTATDILNLLANAFQQIQAGNADALNSVSSDAMKKITPLINGLEKIPQNTLPTEAQEIYNYYSQMLLDTKTVCEKTPNALAENGQIESDYYALVLQLGNYGNETDLNLKIAQALNNFDDGHYTLPDEYQQLLNKKYDGELTYRTQNTQTDIPITEAPATDAAAVMDEETTTPSPEPTTEQIYLPLEIEGIRYDTNSIGIPEIYIRVKNIGGTPIDAFDFAVKCFDNYGDVVKGYGRYDYEICTYQGEDGAIGAGEVYSASQNDRYWTMHGYDTATHYEVALVKVHTTDGTTHQRNAMQFEWIEQNE